MSKELKEAVLPITGYLDPMSARQGELISVKVSAAFQGTYHVDTVRIISADPNPEGPGVLYEPRDFGLEPTYRARPQDINIGSYAVVPGNVYFTGEAMLFTVLVQPWLLKEETSVIACALDSVGVGWQLSTRQGKLVFSYQAAGSELHQVELPDALKYKNWH
ncbi:MAG TPA: hypothetical protein EYQ00_09025, partial [Dehalococcoidia bacterium]|nr:hypothetical protein [Dehalococcoidia bacterium]